MARRTDPPATTVRQVRERDGGCVGCGTTNGLTTQHRVPRGMGGSRAEHINRPANLITLCGSGTTGCHGWAEAHPTEAKALGLAVSKWADPAEVQVHVMWRGWVLLDNEGGWAPAPALTNP